MSSHERRTLKVLLSALDEDVEEMSDAQVKRELTEAGVDVAKSVAAFKSFGEKAIAAARRRSLDEAERTLAVRPKPLDLFEKVKQLTLNLTDAAIRSMIIERGGLAPSHRARDGTNERDLLVQTLAEVMALKGDSE